MKKKQYIITLVLLSFFILSNISCYKQKAYIKNKALEKQIELFVEKAKSNFPSYNNKPETISIRFKKTDNYFIVYFDYKLFIDNQNLYTIIELKNRTIFIISDTEISNYIYTDKPYKASESKYKSYKKTNNAEIDWYRDFQYFDGQNFSRKESDMKK